MFRAKGTDCQKRYFFPSKLKNRAEKRGKSAKLDQFSVLWQSVPLRDRAYCSKHFLSVSTFTTKVLLTIWQSVHPFGCYNRISGFVLRFEGKKLTFLIDLQVELITFPSQSQSVERSVKLVSEASKVVYGFDNRHKTNLTKVQSRIVWPHFMSKWYYSKNYDDFL